MIACLIISISLMVASVTAQSGSEDEVCFPLRHLSAERLQGPPGPQGERGIPGNCSCNMSEIEKINDRIRKLNDSFLQNINDLRKPSYFVEHCSVGMKDRRVRDGDIIASSAATFRHAARQGRLDFADAGYYSGWASRRSLPGDWLQVDLKSPTLVTGVITQGRGDSDQWITSFKIAYGDSTSKMHVIQDDDGDKIFPGNHDRNTYVMNRFPQPITARYFRLISHTAFHHVSLRMEYITC